MNRQLLDKLVDKSQGIIQPYDPWLAGLVEQHIDSVSMRVNYYRFLYWLVDTFKPAVSLELGVEFGVASAYMARAASKYGGKVIGVDKLFKPTPIGQVSTECPNYTYLLGDSTSRVTINSVGQLVKEHGPIGLVFQDSSHHYAPSVAEWNYYNGMLSDTAIWVCDDVTSAFFEEGVDEKSMEVYFDERPGNKAKYKDLLHYGNTIGVIWQ